MKHFTKTFLLCCLLTFYAALSRGAEVCAQASGELLAGWPVGMARFTLSGYLKDAANGEGLISATIFVKDLNTGTATNVYGFYSLTLPAGKYSISFSYVGYVTQHLQVEVTENRVLDVQLVEQQKTLQEFVIASKKFDYALDSPEMSINKLEIRTIRNIPALLGEIDLVRSIQLLPGISTVGEGASGFNVRGGGVDQNLILLDEAPVYNTAHLFGAFSIFNPDAVKDVKLLKGGIAAQYGGRLSSMLDVRMKEGNAKKLSVSGGLGLLSGRLSVEAPLIKDKSSFIVAARRSWGDAVLKAIPSVRNNDAYFYDLSTKFNYTLNEKNRFYVSGYFGRDVFRFGNDLKANWGNATGTLRWNHLFSSRLFANFTAIYSNYDYNLGTPEGATAFDLKSNIINHSGKADFTYYLNTDHTINFGGSAIRYHFVPGKELPLGNQSIYDTILLPDQYAVEYAAYLDNEQSINSRLMLQYGLRFSVFNLLGKTTLYDYVGVAGEKKLRTNPRTYERGESAQLYTNLEPRFSARYSLNGSSSLKLSYNRMAQYIHLMSNSAAAFPLDIWTPCTNNIKPEIADQVTIGYFRNFKQHSFEASVEIFYKKLSNQIDYIDGSTLVMNEEMEGELLYGKGRAYGLELFVKKNNGRLNGWLSYTLSRAEKQIEGINHNRYYLTKYDRTHNLSLVGIYQLSPRVSLSGNFAYGTGVATTFPNGRYVFQGMVIPHNTGGTRNNYRVPAYHRLDLSMTLIPRKKEGRKNDSNWVLSIYNVYSRKNAFTVFFRQNADNPKKTEAVRITVFGSIIPSVTYNFKF